jgi:hypothetical protein
VDDLIDLRPDNFVLGLEYGNLPALRDFAFSFLGNLEVELCVIGP